MKAVLTVVTLFISILFSTSVIASETFKDESAMRAFCDSFMKKIGSGDLSGAYDSLKPYANMNSIEIDKAAEELKEFRQKFAMQYGPSTGYEFISEKKIDDLVFRLIYVEKAEKQLFPWYFIFFKSGNSWKLDEWNWTDHASVLFQDN